MDVVSIVDALYRPLQQMAIADALYVYGIDIKIDLLLFRRRAKSTHRERKGCGQGVE